MRRFIVGLAGLVILLALAWLGLWVYAEIRLKQLVEAKIEQINTSDTGHITYRQIVTSRSPLVAGVTMLDPQLAITFSGSSAPFTISAARIGAHVDLLHPLTLHVDIPLKFMLNGAGAPAVLTFATATITETLTPSVWQGDTSNPIVAGDADYTGINLLASNGSLQVMQIDRLALHQALDAMAGTDRPALMLTADMQNLRVSPILTRLFALPFNGEVSRLSASLSMSGPLNWEQIAKQQANLQNDDQRTEFLLQTFHQWAASHGHAQGSLKLSVGPSHMQTSFTLAFDQQVQPEGKVDVNADHLGEFANTLAGTYPDLRASISQAQAALSPYMSTTPENGQALALHVIYGQSGVFVNGKKTATPPPLDWNDLLNPAVPPAFAPGDGSGAALN